MRDTTIQPRPRGFTLMEMIVACAITTILAVALGSIVMLASKVMPRAKAVTASRIEERAARAADLIASDLSQAIDVPVLTANYADISVPDRDKDGTPEQIVYAWSGTKKDPLTRSVNGKGPVNVLDNVDDFTLTPEIVSRDKESDGAETTSAEMLLASYTGSAGTNQPVESNAWPTVSFPVNLPLGARAYTVSRVELYISRVGLLPGADHLQLRTAWADGTPTSTTFATATMPGGILALAAGWRSYTPVYSGSSRLRSRMLAMVLAHNSGSSVLRIATTSTPVLGIKRGVSTDSGVTFHMGDGSWAFRVYGRAMTAPTITTQTDRVRGVAISLRPTGLDLPISCTARTTAEPLAP